MSDKILFTITFVYGIIIPLSYTKLFRFKIRTVIDGIFNLENNPRNTVEEILMFLLHLLDWIELALLKFSLFYQVYFWFFKIVKLEI